MADNAAPNSFWQALLMSDPALRGIGQMMASRQAAASEEAGYQQAINADWPSSKGGEQTVTPGQPGTEEQVDPINALLQNTMLGMDVALPGIPATPPVIQRTPPSAVFTQRTIPIPAHRGGGTFTQKRNASGYLTAKKAEKSARLLERGVTGVKNELLSLYYAELATAEEGLKDLDLPSLIAITKQVDDKATTYSTILNLAQRHIEDPQSGGWGTFIDVLEGADLQIDKETFDAVQEELIDMYMTRATDIPDPIKRDAQRRAISNAFDVPAMPPVTRGKDLGQHSGTAALLGIGPEDPVPQGAPSGTGQSFAEQVVQFEREADRPRLSMAMIESLGKMGNFSNTMDEIYEIWDNPETSKHITGPAAPIRNILEDLGIWVDTDRVAVRSKVTQLWEILYATRGKQLSDREILMSKDLFASIKLPRGVFEAKLDAFSSYVYNAQIEQLWAHKRAGGDIGDYERALAADDLIRTSYPDARRDGRGYFHYAEDGKTKEYLSHPDLLGAGGK